MRFNDVLTKTMHKAHLQWLDSAGGKQLNLKGADLRDANLKGANLKGADLEEARLSGANLKGANIEGANLKGANLINANLINANLKGAHLEEARLSGANLKGAKLYGAKLCGADLRDANLKGAKIDSADLRDANLKGANLKRAHLEHTYFKSADLRDTCLIGGYFKGAYFKGAYLEGAKLKGAKLKGAKLKGAYLEGANLEGANLKGAYLDEEGSAEAPTEIPNTEPTDQKQQNDHAETQDKYDIEIKEETESNGLDIFEMITGFRTGEVEDYFAGTDNANSTDNNGNTILMRLCKIAAINGADITCQLIERCINKGADINLKNNEGYTALIFAMSSQSMNEYDVVKVAKYLITNGADVNVMIDGYNEVIMQAKALQNVELYNLLIASGAKE